MKEALERVKSIPAPLWIGAIFVIVIAFFLTRRQGSSAGGAVVGAPSAASGSNDASSSIVQQLSANQTATTKSLLDLSTSFNSGLKQIVEHENANNANTLSALTSMSQADAQRTAALQTGFQQAFQQLVTVQARSDQNTASALEKISQSFGVFGSAITSLGSSLQTLRQQQSAVYTGPSEIPIQVTSGGGSTTGAASIPGVASGPGGRNDQARSVAADIGTHSALVNGQVVTINKTYAQATQAEKAAMNAFANR